jgi:hypothetical protein
MLLRLGDTFDPDICDGIRQRTDKHVPVETDRKHDSVYELRVRQNISVIIFVNHDIVVDMRLLTDGKSKAITRWSIGQA